MLGLVLLSNIFCLLVKAIARAVALKREVLILDDVFSAVDPSTKSNIVSRLLGPTGLARSHQMAVLSTTHDSKSMSKSRGAVFYTQLLISSFVLGQGVWPLWQMRRTRSMLQVGLCESMSMSGHSKTKNPKMSSVSHWVKHTLVARQERRKDNPPWDSG